MKENKYLFTYYVGANNRTGVVEREIDDETLTDKLVSIKTGMCELLEQKAILLTRNPVGVTW